MCQIQTNKDYTLVPLNFADKTNIIELINKKGALVVPYNRRELGKFLRKAREKANLTQADVAEFLGYSSPQFISNIERGVSVAPLELISKMVRLYKIKPETVTNLIMNSQRKYLNEALNQAN
ncbi:MAG: helix-turn-helix domain-containing protein [Bdellovibrionales bacterium]